MTRRAYLALLLLFAAAPVAAQKPAEQQLDSIFARFNRPNVPGCAVAAAAPGVRLEKAYGMADLERPAANTTSTIFEAGSVSKQFTAAAVVLLAQRGKLSLDDDIRKYVPEVPALGGKKITIRQMLNHTSGLRDWGVVAALQGWPRGTRAYTNAHVLDIVARQQKLNFDPGTEWNYSNTNYNLAAILVQRVSGLSLAEFTRKELFGPLGMTHTSWRDDYTRVVPGRALAYEMFRDTATLAMPNENAYGNGGLLTTVGDLLLWNDELTTGKVLGKPLVDELQKGLTLANGKPDGYGLGLFLDDYRGEREIAHTGATGAYVSVLSRIPARGISVALLCNAGNANTSQIGHQVTDLLLGDVATKATPAPAAAPQPPRFAIEAADLQRYAGVYRDRGTAEPMAFQVGEGVLKSGRMVLEPLSAAEFRTPARPDYRLVFQPSPKGGRPKALAIAGKDTTRLDPVASPDTSKLPDYAGPWYSPEADATWVLKLEGGKLFATIAPSTRFELRPAYADAFVGAMNSVWQFDRDASGKVTGMGLWVARVKDMRFVKR